MSSERDEWLALTTEPRLDMLPKAALVASIRSLAQRCLDLTDGRSALAVVEPAVPARRPETPNMASPHLQSAFIEGARAALGAPSQEDCEALVGKRVELIFNVDWHPAQGVLTDVIDHPSAGGVNLILDNYRERVYPLNSIQSIKEVP